MANKLDNDFWYVECTRPFEENKRSNTRTQKINIDICSSNNGNQKDTGLRIWDIKKTVFTVIRKKSENTIKFGS